MADLKGSQGKKTENKLSLAIPEWEKGMLMEPLGCAGFYFFNKVDFLPPFHNCIESDVYRK